MAEFNITHTGVSDVESATALPYRKTHLTDFMDVWPTKGEAFGLDHVFYQDGEVEFRVMGYKLEDIPTDDSA